MIMDLTAIIRAVADIKDAGEQDANVENVITKLREEYRDAADDRCQKVRFSSRIQALLAEGLRREFLIHRAGNYSPTPTGRDYINNLHDDLGEDASVDQSSENHAPTETSQFTATEDLEDAAIPTVQCQTPGLSSSSMVSEDGGDNVESEERAVEISKSEESQNETLNAEDPSLQCEYLIHHSPTPAGRDCINNLHDDLAEDASVDQSSENHAPTETSQFTATEDLEDAAIPTVQCQTPGLSSSSMVSEDGGDNVESEERAVEISKSEESQNETLNAEDPSLQCEYLIHHSPTPAGRDCINNLHDDLAEDASVDQSSENHAPTETSQFTATEDLEDAAIPTVQCQTPGLSSSSMVSEDGGDNDESEEDTGDNIALMDGPDNPEYPVSNSATDDNIVSDNIKSEEERHDIIASEEERHDIISSEEETETNDGYNPGTEGMEVDESPNDGAAMGQQNVRPTSLTNLWNWFFPPSE